MDRDVKNCYVCNEYLGPFKNKLNANMEASGKSIYKLLESLLATQINKSTRSSSSICQTCFIKLDRYEDLQKEAESIQENLFSLFHCPKQEHFELVQIKIETPDSHGMDIQCSKCGENFASLSGLNGHKNCLDKLEEYLDDSDEEYLPPTKKKPKKETQKNLNKKISGDFKELAEKSGVTYNFESFQKAFNAPVEKPRKLSQPKIELKTEASSISRDFTKVLKENGISYNLQTFHRVFGFSDSLELPKKAKQLKDGFKCAKCDAEFTRIGHYQNHVKLHTIGEFTCEECQINFQTKILLDLHLSSNHGRQKEGPFVCPICLKSYRKKDLLRAHLGIHNEERKFLCPECGATFVHKKSFQMHVMIHGDIRPYECEVCSKRFRSKTKLTVHLRIHTGERRYECPHCPGKTFRQKWGMDLHIKKTHLNETAAANHACQICGASFQHKSKLRQHLVNSHQVANANNYGDYDGDQ